MSLGTDSLYQRLGGLELPVTAASIGASGLASLDPGRDLLLELFAAAINAELTDAWTKVTGAFGYRESLGPLPVSDKLPDEPTDTTLRQRKGKFPLLAIHRSGTGTYDQATLELARLTQPWTLHYILGPLDVIDARQLKDICVAVAKIVALVVRKRGHRAFRGGALQFFGSGSPDTPSPFTSLRVVSHEGPGQAAFGGDNSSTIYWAIEIRLESTEITSDIADADSCDLEGLTLTVGLGGGEGVLPSAVIAKSDQDPNG
ncbi:hypothetical protein [Caudoviricetes sp.]|nr:hypothetical protein [Caudoviricetes sp.]